MTYEKGFTLVELLVSIAIITLMVGVSVPVYETFARRNDLDLSAQTVAETLRRAAGNSRAVNGDSVWGVYVASNNVTLFKGASYAARDTTVDEVITIPASLTLSGLTEITFAKLSAAPSSTGTLTLISNSNATRQVSINAKGSVDY